MVKIHNTFQQKRRGQNHVATDPFKTSSQSILINGPIAAAYGRFTGIHQVAPLCTPLNTCFLGPTRVHNLDGITMGSAIFAQLSAECRWACPGMYFPIKIAHGAMRSGHSCFFGPTRVHTPNDMYTLTFINLFKKLPNKNSA